MGRRCVVWAASGALLGASYTAWAQDPTAVAPLAVDPSTALLLDLLRAGGLPGVLAFLGFAISRLGPPTLRVVLVREDEKE